MRNWRVSGILNWDIADIKHSAARMTEPVAPAVVHAESVEMATEVYKKQAMKNAKIVGGCNHSVEVIAVNPVKQFKPILFQEVDHEG